MTKRLFGTDGVRGVANVELTCDLAFRLGQAAAVFLGSPIVLGKDSRRSGDMLEAAFVAGATSSGSDIYIAGIIPTPAVAVLTRETDAAGGVVVSSSHNAPDTNGIKFFDADGFKLDVELEDRIEEFLHGEGGAPTPTGLGIGQVYQIDDAPAIYGAHALDTVEEGLDFSHLTVALDCGHGAASLTTPNTLRELGCKVFSINDDFDGDQINVESGSTHLEAVMETLEETGADIGLAHDGDADRLLAIDENGEVVDGDFIEAICAIDLHDRGVLEKDTVVSTIMCNLGFVKAMEEHGITVVQTAVGDRNVLSSMREEGYMLGGEQSGHMIFLEHNSTGDGLVTALQLLSVMARSGKRLSELAAAMKRYPQHLVNVPVGDKTLLEGNEAVEEAIRKGEVELDGNGRVLVRPSGTEPIVRVMVEAGDEQTAVKVAEGIAEIISSELGAAG